MSTLSENLKLFRKINGFTQNNFAEMLSLKRCTVGAYEEGRAEPCISKFLEICKFYNVSPFDFYKKNSLLKTLMMNLKIVFPS